MDKKRKPQISLPLSVEGSNSAEGMVLNPSDSSKLVPPRNSARIVVRERLNAQLLDARRRACIVLKGPTGCGKTTALISWRQMLLPLGFDVAWLALGADDNELTRLIDFLLASLTQVDPAITKKAITLEGRGTDNEVVERTLITLVRGIVSHPRDVVLVLDDLHHLTDARIHDALQWLIDYAPANLHIALASRSTVPLSLARLRSQEQTLELDLRDLRFTPAESEQFLKAQLGNITPDDAQLMYEMTDGWAAGLQLLSISRKNNGQTVGDFGAGALTPAHVLDTQAFATFFEIEVLSHLSPTDLNMLVDMAMCNRFCASLCAALIGRPEALGEAVSLLTRLESDNLFLSRIDSAEPETWYRLHPLLRETLLKHVNTRSEAEQRELHARAWPWFRDREYLDEAVHHAILGGESAAATALIEQHAELLYASGDLRMLITLVRQMPPEQIRSSIKLRIVVARMQLYARNFAACAESLEQLERDLPDSDSLDRIMLCLLQATLAVQRDDSDGAMTVLPQLQHPSKNADAVVIGACCNILSWLYIHRGEYELARRIQIDRPALLIHGVPLLGTTSGSLYGRCLTGLSLAFEGQMAQAERVYREVLYEAERGGKACTDAACLAAALLGDALYETNDVGAAHQLLSSRVDILERVSIPDSVLRVLMALAKSHWLAGNRQEAFSYLERLEDYSTKLGLDRLRSYSLVWRFYWHLLLGEFLAAETKLAQLDAINARHPNVEHGALNEIRILTENAHIRWQANQGDLDGAMERLEQLNAFCERHGRKLAVARLQMLSAVIDTQRGRMDSARDKMLTALRLGHQLGLVRTLVDTHPTTLDMIRKLVSSETLDPVLTFYVERLQSCEREPHILSANMSVPTGARRPPTSGMGDLSKREIEVVRLLAQALPNKKIARALSLSPETVKWHLSHIYTKLGVNSRDEAVSRVRDLESRMNENTSNPG